MTWNVPRRLLTERLEIRCYRPDDAEAMSQVIPANREHLMTYLPWAAPEPISAQERAATIDRFITEFDEGKDFTLGIFDRADGTYLGGTGFHPRIGPTALEIGYWIRVDREGEGLITESTAALARTAIELMGADWAEIRCEPGNLPSRRVAERLGFTLTDTRIDACGNCDRKLVEIWQLTREALPASAAADRPRPAAFASGRAPIHWPEETV